MDRIEGTVGEKADTVGIGKEWAQASARIYNQGTSDQETFHRAIIDLKLTTMKMDQDLRRWIGSMLVIVALVAGILLYVEERRVSLMEQQVADLRREVAGLRSTIRELQFQLRFNGLIPDGFKSMP